MDEPALEVKKGDKFRVVKRFKTLGLLRNFPGLYYEPGDVFEILDYSDKDVWNTGDPEGYVIVKCSHFTYLQPESNWSIANGIKRVWLNGFLEKIDQKAEAEFQKNANALKNWFTHD